MTETTTTEPVVEHTMRLSETAELLGVHTETVRTWVKRKGLPAVKPGKALLFSRAAVVAWHAQQAARKPQVQP
jgi:hypothetical protein